MTDQTVHKLGPDEAAGQEAEERQPSKPVVVIAFVSLVISGAGAGTYGWPYIAAAVLSGAVIAYEMYGPITRYVDTEARTDDRS